MDAPFCARPWWLRCGPDRNWAVGARLYPVLDRSVSDDPTAADQRSLERATLDRAPDGPVLTSRQLSNFLDGQVRTAAHFRLPAQTLGPPRVLDRKISQIRKGPLNVSRASDGKAARARGFSVLPARASSSAPVARSGSPARQRRHGRRGPPLGLLQRRGPSAGGDSRPRARRAARARH